MADGWGPMARQTLKDRTLRNLKPAPKGERYELLDAIVPGLGIRVTDTGKKTFFLQARYPGPRRAKDEEGAPLPGRRPPTRRALGEYGAISLEEARQKARGWLEVLQRGVDPSLAELEARRAAERQALATFESVAEAFIEHIERDGQRKADVVARELRKEFIPVWRDRPITSVTADDVTDVIDAVVARGAPYSAHNHLSNVRRLFNWAIARRRYGLDHSPCDRMRPKEVIGKKASRTRILNDNEIRAFWRAATAMEYPYGPLFKLLLVTIQRKSEIADAVRSERNLNRALLEIPAERMKMGAGHVVPLSPLAVEIFSSLPEFEGKYLFTTTFGEKPVDGFSKAKKRLDALMLLELGKVAAEAGGDADKVRLQPFVLHDLRRTGRTALSSLPISDIVRELVIAHAKPGLHKVYDQYAYLEEKRQALELWSNKLQSIIEPRPSNVLPFKVG